MISKFHCLDACLSPYNDFLSLQAFPGSTGGCALEAEMQNIIFFIQIHMGKGIIYPVINSIQSNKHPNSRQFRHRREGVLAVLVLDLG